MKKTREKIQVSEIAELEQLLRTLVDLPRNEVEKGIRRIRWLLRSRDFRDHEGLYNRSLLKLGEIHGRNLEVEESAKYFEQVRDIAIKSNNPGLLKKAMANLGITLAQRDLYREALDVWHELLREEDVLDRKLSLLNNICVANGIIGEYHSAIQAAYAVISLAEEHNETVHHLDALQNLGAIYDKMDDPQKALQFWERTLELNRSTGNVRREFEVLGNLALAYVRIGEHQKALDYALASVKLKIKHLPEESLGIGYNNIGYIYESAGDYVKALEYYKKGESFYQKLRRDSALAHCYMNEASLYLKMEKLDDCLRLLDEAGKIENACNALQNHVQLTHLYAELYKAKKDYPKALEYVAEQNRILQDQLDKKRSSTISIEEAEYYRKKIEKQAREYLEQNKDLKRKNRIISKTTKELKERNANLADTVEVLKWLISVISHDVRAPIANFSRMLEMMLDGVFPIDDHNEILASMKKSSDSIFKLINDMLDGIRLKRHAMDFNIKIDSQNIVPILNSVMEIYQPMASQKKISLSFSAQDPKIYAIVDGDLLKILVRNLLNNAMKFTDVDGSVSITASTAENKVRIEISDNGIGMNATALDNLRKGKGIKRNSGDGSIGLGLVLCQDALKRMKGTLRVDSKLGEGTRIVILLPAG